MLEGFGAKKQEKEVVALRESRDVRWEPAHQRWCRRLRGSARLVPTSEHTHAHTHPTSANDDFPEIKGQAADSGRKNEMTCHVCCFRWLYFSMVATTTEDSARLAVRVRTCVCYRSLRVTVGRVSREKKKKKKESWRTGRTGGE